MLKDTTKMSLIKQCSSFTSSTEDNLSTVEKTNKLWYIHIGKLYIAVNTDIGRNTHEISVIEWKSQTEEHLVSDPI